MMSLIPMPYRILAVILAMAASIAFGYVKGISHEQAKWHAAEAVRIESERDAMLKREADNAKLAATQAATNSAITKGKEDEIAGLNARVTALGRLRIGSSICGGSSASTTAESAGSGNDSNPSAGLVSEQSDRDFKSLIIAVETDLATGRACQSFVKDNGLAP